MRSFSILFFIAVLLASCTSKAPQANGGSNLPTLKPFPMNDEPETPINWSIGAVALGGDEYELVFKAQIDEGWVTYSQFLEGPDGPQSTAFEVDSANAVMVGPGTEEGHKIEGYDEMFEMQIIKFKDEAVFRHKVKVKDKTQPVTGYFTFMACDNTKCLPPKDVDFSIVMP